MGLLDKILKGRSVKEFDEQNDDAELAKFIRSKVDEIRSSANRTANEATWLTNAAYVVGFNNVVWNANTRSYQPLNRVSAAFRPQRIQVNKILPTLQNRAARICKNPPRYDVRPNDGTQEARDNARYKLNVLDAKFDELHFNELRIKRTMNIQEFGHTYLGVHWDDAAGNIMEDPITGENQFEGDVRLELYSPFEVFPDPLAKSLDEAEFYIRCKVRNIKYFQNHYGEKGLRVKKEEVWLQSLQYDQRIQTMSTRGPASGNAAFSLQDCAVEMVYEEKPSLKYKKGRYIVCAGSEILCNKELPVGRFSLVKYDDIVVGNKYYPESTVTHLRPLQDEFNELKRRRNDWMKKFLAGKYISARGSNIIKEAFTDENGEFVEYDPVPNAPDGGKPTAIQVPALPQWAFTEEDRIDQEFNEISGISEVSKGNLPSASIPALGMQILVEQDDTRIGIMIEQHENSDARVGGLILDYIQKYYKTYRKIKYAQKNDYVVRDLIGSDLLGANDVIVIRGSTVPGSKALRRQEILNLYDRGLLGAMQDSKVQENVLDMMEYGDLSEAYIDLSLDKAQFDKQIKQIEEGEMPEVDEGDNHVFMIQELNRYRKSDKYSKLPDESKIILKLVIEAHLQEQMKIMGVPQGMPSPTDKIAADMNAEESTKEDPILNNPMNSMMGGPTQ